MGEEIQAPHQFTIRGSALRSMLEQLKPALPTRRGAGPAVAVFKVRPDRVAIALPGAEVGAQAVASGTFAIELPAVEVNWLQGETFGAAESLVFSFAPGQITFRGITITSEQIRVGQLPGPAGMEAEGGPAREPAPAAQTAAGAIADPVDGAVGLPLLAIYHTLRKHPDGTFASNERLQVGRAEIESILKRADKLLKPLGIGRADVEAILNGKADRASTTAPLMQ